MSSVNEQVYLIIGASRGIGLALVKSLAGRSGTTVIGSARGDISQATDLTKLATSHENVHVVSIEATDLSSLKAAARSLQDDFNIQQIDALIVNAAITGDSENLDVVKRENFLHGLEVNVLGSILTYQAFRPLLDATLISKNHKGIFVSISSEAGNTGTPLPVGNITYSTSKAALNHVSAQINLENESIHAIAIHPGLVETDMSSTAAGLAGMTLQEMSNLYSVEVLTPDHSAAKLLQVIDAEDVQKYAGKFVDYNGKILPL